MFIHTFRRAGYYIRRLELLINAISYRDLLTKFYRQQYNLTVSHKINL